MGINHEEELAPFMLLLRKTKKGITNAQHCDVKCQKAFTGMANLGIKNVKPLDALGAAL